MLTEQAKALLENFYLKEGETPEDGFFRCATAFCNGDLELRDRLFFYFKNQWFIPASPVLSNAPNGKWVDGKFEGEKGRAMPISCFLTYIEDTIDGQIDGLKEIAHLSVGGGGVGCHNGIRAIGGKAPGPIPFEKVLDSYIGYFQQGAVRRGSLAYYMDVSHPDILEHIRFRIPGGDHARKSDNRKNFHSAVNISDDFIKAVINGTKWDLVCPHSKEVRETVDARGLFEEMLQSRVLRGEVFFCFSDVVREGMNPWQRDKGLEIHGSNLCTEILLPTGKDRTAVCCLSSLNLYWWDEIEKHGASKVVGDCIVFLDNVLQYFIDNAGDGYEKAVYSARMERSLGLGTLGFHSYLQKKGIAFESGGYGSAVQVNRRIFEKIKSAATRASKKLAKKFGEPEDIKGSGMRNAHLLAIAPNANSSIIAGTSPSIEPFVSNCFVHKTRVGSHTIKNVELQKILKEKGLDNDETWADIMDHQGSVQHVDYLSDEEKKIFKTAFEIDQHWVIQHAEDRQQFICQGQSTNLFFPSGADADYVLSVHLKAMTGRKIKTLYYYRTNSKVIADTAKNVRRPMEDWSDPEVCVACEG